MKRGETGTYEATSAGGEVVRDFVPAPLPPNPPLDFGGGLQPAHLLAIAPRQLQRARHVTMVVRGE
nr:Fic family protein [Thermoanaerobaculia bacterium]